VPAQLTASQEGFRSMKLVQLVVLRGYGTLSLTLRQERKLKGYRNKLLIK
jgi:hypothetical protein